MKKVRFALVFILVFAFSSLFSYGLLVQASSTEPDPSVQLETCDMEEILPLPSFEKYDKLYSYAVSSTAIYKEEIVENLNNAYEKGFLIVEVDGEILNEPVTFFMTGGGMYDYLYNIRSLDAKVRINFIEKKHEQILMNEGLFAYLRADSAPRGSFCLKLYDQRDARFVEYQEAVMKTFDEQLFPIIIFLTHEQEESIVTVVFQHKNSIVDIIFTLPQKIEKLQQEECLQTLSRFSFRVLEPNYAGPLDNSNWPPEPIRTTTTTSDVNLTTSLHSAVESVIDTNVENMDTNEWTEKKSSIFPWIVGGVVFLCILIAATVFTLRRHNSHSDSQKK